MILMLVPDIHDIPQQFNFRNSDGIPRRLAESTASKEWIAKEAVDKKVDMIIQMGDYWDKPDRLDGPSILASLTAWAAIPVNTIVLRGNHDFDSKWDASQLLALCANTTVLTKPTSMYLQAGNAFLGFIPFQRNEETFTAMAATLTKEAIRHSKTVKKYLFIHQGIKGFIPNAAEAFERTCIEHKHWTKVFSGHYHSGFESGFIQYLGSLVPTSFEPIGSDRFTENKGVTLLDTNTGKTERLLNPYSPVFIAIEIENFENLKEAVTPELAARSYLKIRYQLDSERKKLDYAFLAQFRDYDVERKTSTQEKERDLLWKLEREIGMRSKSSVVDLAVRQLSLGQQKDEAFIKRFRQIGESEILRKG